MKARRSAAKNIDEYSSRFPSDVRKKLDDMRSTIRKAARGASEKISYEIPTFTLEGNLVHFAAFKHHIGFYPGAAAMREFAAELSDYVTGKGSVQFPFDRPLPLRLVARIVEFRVEANRQKANKKREGK